MNLRIPTVRSCSLLLSLFTLLGDQCPTFAAALGVSPSGRHLTVEGTPFFWLGDTVWLLAQVPSRDELERYLRTRAEQGFTVIQLTAVMGEERVGQWCRTQRRHAECQRRRHRGILGRGVNREAAPRRYRPGPTTRHRQYTVADVFADSASFGSRSIFRANTPLTVPEFHEDQDRNDCALFSLDGHTALKAKRAEAFWALFIFSSLSHREFI